MPASSSGVPASRPTGAVAIVPDHRLAVPGDDAYLPTMSVIALTPAAAARVAAVAARQGKPPILRLTIEGGGCSGFQYRFGLADAPEADDAIAREGDATLVVDPISLDLVQGARVDYVESLGGAAFRVDNPNAAAGCGCGSSFAI